MIRALHRILLSLCLALPLAAPAGELLEQSAPRLDLELIDGGRLAADALDGKVVLTLFWATWCPTCVGEMPKLQRLYQAYREQGFEIVAVSLDEYPEEVVQFLTENGYSFPVAMRTGEIKQAWGPVPATPQMLLSDRAGIVRFDHLGAIEYEALEARLKALL